MSGGDFGNSLGGQIVNSWNDSNGMGTSPGGSVGGLSAHQGLYDSASGMVYGAGPIGGLSAPYTPQPKQQSNPFALLMGLFGGVMSLFGSRSAKAPTDLSVLMPESVAAFPEQPLPATPIYVPNYGGTKDALVPHLTGIANVDGRGAPDPAVWGVQKIYPPNAARQLTTILGSNQYLYCLFNCGYGRLDLSDFKIGEKALTEYAGTDGLGYAIEPREGTASDAPITLYTQDVEPEEFGVELKYNEPIIKTAKQSADRLVVDCYCPNGLYQTLINGQGESVEWSSSVTIKVEYRLAGSSDSWTEAGNVVVYGQTYSIARGYLDWTVTKALYEVRLTRTSGAGAGEHEDFTQWAILRAFDTTTKPRAMRVDWNGDPIYTSEVALKFLATEDANGQLDSFSLIAKKYVPVYSDGSWSFQLSANNAWVCVGMLTTAWTAQPLTYSDLHIPDFVEWAEYCDSEGFTFNYTYTSEVELREAVDNVCAAGFARLVLRSNGKWGVAIDKPKTQVAQIITPLNSWGFEGTLNYVKKLDAINVEFVNPDGQWQQDVRVVYNDGKDQSNAYVRETIRAVGINSPTHAWKLGRRKMAEAELRAERYYVNMDWENLLCEQGDLVWLNHDVPQFGLGAALITSVTTDINGDITAIHLDEGILVTLGEVVDITIRLSDGSVVSRTVTGTGQHERRYQLSAPIDGEADEVPERNNLVIIGGYAICQVVSIEHNTDGSAKLTLEDYAPGVFESTTGDIPEHVTQIKTAEKIQQAVPAPTVLSVKSDESVLLKDTSGTYQTRVQINFTPPPASIAWHQYKVKLSNSTEWIIVNHTPASSAGQIYVTEVQDAQIVDIYIRNVERTGKASAWVPILNHFVVGKTTKPPAVPAIHMHGQLGSQRLAWVYDDISLGEPVPQDFAGFQTRVGTGSWATAQILDELTTSFSIPVSRLPNGTYIFMIRAVDVAGNMSDTVTAYYGNFGDAIIANVIDTESHAPNFTLGTITNGTVVDGVLYANDDGGKYWNDDNAPTHSGDDSAPHFTTGYEQLEYYRKYTVESQSQVPMQLTTSIIYSGFGFQVWYRRLGTALFWKVGPGADSGPVWGIDDDAPVYDPDPPYIIFPGSILVNYGEQIEFKFVMLPSQNQQGNISKLDINLDVPDLVEVVSDALIDAGGSRLALAKAFREIQVVNIGFRHDVSYTAVQGFVVDYDVVLGPLIRLIDQSGVSVAGRISATIQGVAA